MPQEKEPKEITRRQFLKGATALGASALLSSCGLEASSSPAGKEAPPSSPKLPPAGTPMATSTPFPESTRTETPSFVEPTPPREMITFPQVKITPDLLKQGFGGIGGEEEINLGIMGVLNQGESREKVSWQTIEGYTSLAWNEKMALADLAQDEVGAAKTLISLGAQVGIEGFYQPGEILPQFKDLTLLRLTIDKLPNNQDFYDAKVNAFPQNLVIRKGSHLTVLGLWADESGRWATVAFDEGFDREKEGLQPREVPRQFLAVIPQNLPDEKEGLSLESLLVANGYVYQADMVEHQGESGQPYRQQLNTIELTLAKKLEKEAGALFMDQKEDGSWYENPLVPYPPEEQASSHTVQSGETLSKIAQTYGLTLDELLALNPDIKDPSKITVGQELTILIPGFIAYHGPVLTEDGRVVILSADQTQELAQAKYDEQTKTWEWEKTMVPFIPLISTPESTSAAEAEATQEPAAQPTGEATPTKEITEAPEIEGLVFKEGKYYAKEGNPYGLEEGEYAGEFVPNVTMETKEGKEETTGGLVLTAPVVLAELNQQLAKIPEQDDRWLIPLPVDIRGLEGISITYGKDEVEVPVVKIVYPGSAPLVNIIPEAEKLRIGKTFFGDWIYYDHMRLIEPYTDPIYPGLEMHYLTVRGNFLGFRENITLPTTFGAKIGEAKKPIYVMMEAATDIRSITPDKILYVDQTPVFVAANTP